MCAVQNGKSMNILIKKGIFMRWVKQMLGYRRSGIDEKNAGMGVCVAVLDTGIARHPDLEGRIAGFRDFTGGKTSCYDDSGHGTHVAGILAGDGKMSAGMYAGMAPAAVLLAGKVLDRSGNGNVESVLRGIEWIRSLRKEHPVRIVNISVGTQPELAAQQKLRLLKAVEELWDEGLTVVVSAGNYGPGEGTVAAPGSSPKVITVGVPDTPERSLPGGRNRQKVNYSGRGPTADCVVKPDLFAPGTGIISCNAGYVSPGGPPYIMKTGTSMATPVISGAVACLLSRYPDMTNVEVKLKLRDACVKAPGTGAGWGMPDMERLMQA